MLNNAVEKLFEKEEFSKGVTVCLKMCISTLAGEIANAAQAIQEADITLSTTDATKVILFSKSYILIFCYALNHLDFKQR